MLRHAYEATTLSRQYQAAPNLVCECVSGSMNCCKGKWIFMANSSFCMLNDLQICLDH